MFHFRVLFFFSRTRDDEELAVLSESEVKYILKNFQKI